MSAETTDNLPRGTDRHPSRTEFIALMALMSAMVAFAIDAMLPAMTEIGHDLAPGNPNSAQLILTIFVLGMGVGTFVVGPLADALGRRTVVIGGLVLYGAAAAFAWGMPSLEGILFARFIQGLGAAAPRVVTVAIVRDRYAGPEMAKLMSVVMMVFMIVPAIAPMLGEAIMSIAGWRTIFPGFVIVALVGLTWFALRQPETLAPENRRPVRISTMWTACKDMFGHRIVRQSIMVQTLAFGMLFGLLTSIEGVFSHAYDASATFTRWFAFIAVVSAAGSFLNSRLVVRMGMLRLVRAMLCVSITISALFLMVLALDLAPGTEFIFWMIWTCTIFLQGSLVLGNVNAMAMQPLGHIAGIAASIITAVATVASVVIAIPFSVAYDGTPFPVALGCLMLGIAALTIALRMRAGR